MKLNRIYYQHLIKSLIVVIIGLAFIMKEAYPMGAVSDNYFILLTVILCAFFGVLGVIVLFMRLDKLKFRRKFVYTFFGVANFCISLVSIFFEIRHKTAGVLALGIYIFSFLIGAFILVDVFFGKRHVKQEREMLIS